MAYNGAANVGHVPTGGGATTFLRGDGTWVTPSGSAVIDVDETAPGTSTGTPIVVNPTTGNVLVQSMAYNGGANVGHVPSGSGSDATKYLDGTGAWTVPAGGGGSGDINTLHVTRKFWLMEMDGGGLDWTYNNQLLGPINSNSDQIGQPIALSTITAPQAQFGLLYASPFIGACHEAACKKIVCAATLNYSNDVEFVANIYRVNLCEGMPAAGLLVAYCSVPIVGLEDIGCCDLELSGGSDMEVPPGFGLVLVVNGMADISTVFANIHIEMYTEECAPPP